MEIVRGIQDRADAGLPLEFLDQAVVLGVPRLVDDMGASGAVVPWVFLRGGERILDFMGAWHGACRRAGLVGRIPHDLRRTAARNMIRAGVSQSVAMAIGVSVMVFSFRRTVQSWIDQTLIADLFVVPASNERVGGARFRLTVHPPIEPPNTGDPNRDLVEFTAAMTRFIEERVRERPHEWLWIHKRWTRKDAPLGKRAQALSPLRGGDNSNATSKRV